MAGRSTAGRLGYARNLAGPEDEAQSMVAARAGAVTAVWQQSGPDMPGMASPH
ncbi:hypothetical protein [Micromonospora sp. NPDC049359]|uniref:hypothetical protein n=1 Tax=Micromonospora sp. NPDC049359 TaxID=3364270 RepID=UPI00379D224F